MINDHIRQQSYKYIKNLETRKETGNERPFTI